MPQPIDKSENYTNFGGINEKASQYLLGPNEFINISNFSNEKTGSLTKDYGTTYYIGTTFSSPIYGLFEYARFSVGNSGSSLNAFFPTFTQVMISNQTAMYGMTGGVPLNIFTYQKLSAGSSITSVGKFDFTTFQNTLYACDGSQFLKYNSVSAYAYGIPKLMRNEAFGAQQVNVGGLTGYINYAMSLYNNYGLIGPAFFGSYLITGSSGATSLFIGMNTNTNFGYSFSPANYGCTYKLVWAKQLGDIDYSLIQAAIPYDQATFILTANSFTASAAGFTTFPFSSIGFTQPVDYIGAWNYRFNYDPNGVYANTATPTCLEIFNNQMVMSGVADQPSTVFISDIGQPEIVQFDSGFEVRTNDGDVVTGLKTFFNQLLIFKNFSFHSLRGDNFSNYQLTQLSGEYGALSNRAICVWEQNCWFLDRKGVCSYNGANVQIVSQKMSETFKSMNLTSAASEAIIIHVKEKYEVWVCIPINGSTTNNCVVIYDYVADSWRKREGIAASALLQTITSGSGAKLPQFQTIYGGYSGQIGLFGSTFYTDGANGMTCIARTRYLNNLGNSVTKQFRRLFLDCDTQTGVTLNIGINFYTNQSTMAAYSTTMSLGAFQNRIDFGLPAKDLAVEFVYNSNYPLRINGFTIEYRFQRAV